MTSQYARAGVDLSAGDVLSAYAHAQAKGTWGANPHVLIHGGMSHFRAPRSYSFRGLPRGCRSIASADGIGTKAMFYGLMPMHCDGAGFDLVAMVADDAARSGGLPLVMTNVLDVSVLGDPQSETFIGFCHLFQGLARAAREQQLPVVGGEIAVLGTGVGSETDVPMKFNWSASVAGVMHPQKMITGESLAPGQVVMALLEPGFRSNGISAVRRAFKTEFGDRWWTNGSAKQHFEAVTIPSTPYSNFLCHLNGWHADGFQPVVKMHAIAHITGGGIPGKFFGDLLKPRGLSAVLEELHAPPPLMAACVRWLGMSEKEAYGVFCCGQGALVVINACDADTFVTQADRFGLAARPCGEITGSPTPRLEIHSMFGSNDRLVYR